MSNERATRVREQVSNESKRTGECRASEREEARELVITEQTSKRRSEREAE
jgi:hypothetical protein